MDFQLLKILVKGYTMDRQIMIDALLNKFKQKQADTLKGYKKKLVGQVSTLLQEEYDIVVLGKLPKIKKEKVWNKGE